MIYWAGQNWYVNTRNVAKQALILDILTIGFVLELTLFTWWLLG